MLVEFVGIPGCGKSTLAAHLEKRLTAEGYNAAGLRNAARAAMADMQNKVRFLHRRGERTSLYGCFVYAEANPELFEWVFRASRSKFSELIWNMEALSQMGIVRKYGPGDLIVLSEEGLVQRFAGTFLNEAQAPELDEVNALLPDDFLTIHLKLPSTVAHARTKGRRKGIPAALQDKSDAKVLAHFRRYDKVLKRCVNARISRGCAVLSLNGDARQEAIVEAALEWLRPLLPAIGQAPAKHQKQARP